jgi:hypothetical protein
MRLLKFGKANAKLRDMPGVTVATFSLPAGWTCPSAVDCLAKVDRYTGKLTDGPNTIFRCFAASLEVRPNVRAAVWHNFDALRKLDTGGMTALILESLPKADVTRIDVDGDFFNQKYFDAWVAVARAQPSRHFYAYTKSINYWVARLGEIPDNLSLTASYGGRQDALIAEYGLKSATVVYSEAEAKRLGLEIDHDDTHAAFGTKSFALLIHGVQPKGSDASAAIKVLKADGVRYAYSRR